MSHAKISVRRIIIQDTGICGTCHHFYFDPLKKSHYYLDEDTACGECTVWKFGTANNNKACQKWKIKNLKNQ